jgi:hypothetical protein
MNGWPASCSEHFGAATGFFADAEIGESGSFVQEWFRFGTTLAGLCALILRRLLQNLLELVVIGACC